jgi:hypothetical protein
MATAANRVNPNSLFIGFDYDTEPAIGDVVEITTGRKVQKLTLSGRSKKIGVVTGVRSSLKEATIAVPFRENRIDRVAGEIVAAGPFVFGVDNAVYQYIPATAATHTGANAQTFAIVQGASDVVGVKIGGDEVQSFTLTAGGTRTAAQVAADINPTAVGFTITVTSANKPCFTANGVNQSLEITAETHSANTVLGLTAGVYIGTANSHDPCLVAGLVVVGGAEAAIVETLEY